VGRCEFVVLILTFERSWAWVNGGLLMQFK
jgi:hypothetical protein